MNAIDAFMKATAWAYFGCVFLTILGRPPLAFIRADLQGVIYALFFITFRFASLDAFPQYIYAVLGVVYGFAAIGSFIGFPQVWMAYWTGAPEGGSAAGQIGMAAWDLALAICCFMKSQEEK